jgi:hypothetical protein
MSDDGEVRLWSTAGALAFRFLYRGGSVGACLVDTEHKLVLAAMADMRVRVFDLDDPIPQGRCVPPRRCRVCFEACTRNIRSLHLPLLALRAGARAPLTW